MLVNCRPSEDMLIGGGICDFSAPAVLSKH